MVVAVECVDLCRESVGCEYRTYGADKASIDVEFVQIERKKRTHRAKDIEFANTDHARKRVTTIGDVGRIDIAALQLISLVTAGREPLQTNFSANARSFSSSSSHS